MTTTMVQALLWREWRQTRGQWLLYGGVFHVPALVGLLMLATGGSALLTKLGITAATLPGKFPFIVKAQSLYMIVVGFILISVVTTARLARAWERRSLRALFDEPLSRGSMFGITLLVGGGQALVCASLSVLTTMAIAYGGLRLVGPELGDGLAVVWPDALSAGGRMAVWVGLLTLLAVTNGLLFAVVIERWWVGASVGVVALHGLFYVLNQTLFAWYGPAVGAVRDTNPLTPIPVLTVLLLAGAYYGVAQWVFGRKELM